jgi:hypothetical protein
VLTLPRGGDVCAPPRRGRSSFGQLKCSVPGSPLHMASVMGNVLPGSRRHTPSRHPNPHSSGCRHDSPGLFKGMHTPLCEGVALRQKFPCSQRMSPLHALPAGRLGAQVLPDGWDPRWHGCTLVRGSPGWTAAWHVQSESSQYRSSPDMHRAGLTRSSGRGILAEQKSPSRPATLPPSHVA